MHPWSARVDLVQETCVRPWYPLDHVLHPRNGSMIRAHHWHVLSALGCTLCVPGLSSGVIAKGREASSAKLRASLKVQLQCETGTGSGHKLPTWDDSDLLCRGQLLRL